MDKILMNRLTKKYVPVDLLNKQDFRKVLNYDNNETKTTFMEKNVGYKITIYLAFVDFLKAFDLLEM